ncbi:F0F1 ATP synthase subunit epsilon [Limoniibacter endophyticus]|uniref:ATP synthase epsilon chain n=1 Tax=Limoniibacter endophyticus TaxID=1565040 RepID=A0A8J3GHR1_9HYPH|nr:F0F1 ATP synthase subunit epsilon [Limoniibacter endophyticus]GHC73812.1 ATP synthase epsilon chain [Limoniibacter endophyticus]
MAEQFKFELVSPAKILFSDSAVSVVLPGSEGEMTVMGNHSPLISTLKPGVITVSTANGATDRFVVYGGVADIKPDVCTVLAEAAVHRDQIDMEDIAKRVEDARKAVASAESDQHRFDAEALLANLSHLEHTLKN